MSVADRGGGVQGLELTPSERIMKAQHKQKLWYDQNAHQREFKPGNLVLLPTSAGSLTAQWKGPFPVLHKTSGVNYMGIWKWEQTFHINIMKKWNTLTCGNYC